MEKNPIPPKVMRLHNTGGRRPVELFLTRPRRWEKFKFSNKNAEPCRLPSHSEQSFFATSWQTVAVEDAFRKSLENFSF